MAQVQLKDFKMHYLEQGTGSEPIIFVKFTFLPC